MKPKVLTPPKIGLNLLEFCLPQQVKDEIIGDIHEQFYESNETLINRYRTFWWQTISTIMRYFIMSKKPIALVLSLMSCTVFFVLTVSILFLSNIDDASILAKNYWTDGNFYQLFIDTDFWRLVSVDWFSAYSLPAFFHVPSLIWAGVGFLGLYVWQTKRPMSISLLGSVCLLLLVIPYIWVMINLKLNDKPLNEVGPLLAFVLISAFYLIFPLTIMFVKKLLVREEFA